MYQSGSGGLPKDHAKATDLLGVLLQNGRDGLKRNEAEALALFRHAAAKGDAKAMYDIGLMYDYGLGGLDKDPEQALLWYRKAAAAGHVPAQAYLRSRAAGPRP